MATAGATRRTKVRRSAAARSRAGAAIALAGILLLALALRVSYLREHVHSPDFRWPRVDAGYYDYWARALATNDWTVPKNLSDLPDPEIRTKPYFHPPAYSFFLAPIYRLTNGSYLAPRVVQAGLGLLNCLLAYLLGRRVFGRGVALLFALFMSVYWAFIFFEGELLSPTLLITEGLLLLYLLSLWRDRPALGWAAAAGVVFGLYALTRSNVLLFGPVILLWAVWLSRRHGGMRALLRTAGGFCLGTLVTIAPATIRNYVAGQDLVLITTNGGVNLYVGNNETSTGTYSGIPSLHGLRIENEYYPCVIESVERLVGRKMKDSEVSDWFVDRAVAYMRAHPWQTLRRMAVKAALFWGPVEIPNNKVLGYEKACSPTLRYLPGFPLALAFAVFGLIRLIACAARRATDPEAQVAASRPDRGQIETSALIVLFVLATFASYLPFFIAGRFRVPIIPFLLLFGAYGVQQLGLLIVARRYRAAVLHAALLVALTVAAHIQVVPYEPQPAQRHLLRATCYRLADQIDLAIEECRAATDLDPNSEEGHRRLGDLLMTRGDYRQAVVHYEQADRLRPGRFDVHYNLATAFSALDDPEQAIEHLRQAVRIQPQSADTHYRLAGLLRRQGQIEEAIASYSRAVECREDHAKARRDLAALLLSQQRPTEALALLRWLAEHQAADADAYNLMGIAWKSLGNLDEAVASYRRALDIDPRYYLAHNNLANALAAQGRFDEAVVHYRKALEIKPDYSQAQRSLHDILQSRGLPDEDRQTERVGP
ncbi:MAG: tetratricopeptide repeat protein [Sedimentisphaerales bacterium]|jgi:tetratricopeptide (TPR) repeat protein|nr:tetratricopeptide repeat protein [Sedimentisphaerales bacterium]